MAWTVPICLFVQTTSAGKTSPANCCIKFTFRTFGKKTAQLIPLEFGDTFLNTDDNEMIFSLESNHTLDNYDNG